GRFKVFMIDEVHMLTNTAFNAMLKTLEEPPEYLKFVLATTDPQKVPVTVLSRCLQFNLRPMAPETVLEHLTAVLQTESVPAEPQALRLLARAARGSMRDALSLTDQAIAFGNGELVEAGVRQMLGSVDRGHVFRLIEALAQGDGKTVVETSEALRVDGMSAASTLEEMTAVLQAMAVLQAVPSRAEAAADAAADPDAADTARLAALMPADETQLLYSLCLHGRGELGLAPDEYAALTMVLLRLLAFKPSSAAASTATPEKKTLNEAAAAPPQAPATRVPAPAPALAPVASAPVVATPQTQPPVATAAAPSAPLPAGHRLAVVDEPRQADPRPGSHGDAPTKVVGVPIRVQPPPSSRDAPRPEEARSTFTPIPTSEDGDFWYATVTQLVAAEAITALARELALQSQLVGRDTDQWLLRIERETLNQPSAREKLTVALNGAGHGVKLAIEIGSVVDSPARRNRQAADERQRLAEEAIMSDPEVQALMRDFDAKIVPGTLKPA
uniref:DNA polymerase III subunit gamma/tau C-terminal domain-containing protein n=1 Tax=uncultured Variovorax sp. TaxID=114708 RepID=UPI0025CC7A1A